MQNEDQIFLSIDRQSKFMEVLMVRKAGSMGTCVVSKWDKKPQKRDMK